MKTIEDVSREMGIYDNPKECPKCHTKLTFANYKQASFAYVHTMWYCGNCGADVQELVYGRKVKNIDRTKGKPMRGCCH